MATEILSERYSTFNFAHSAATVAKTFYLIQAMVMMAMNTELISVSNVFVYRGLVRVPKNAGEAWVCGVAIYWDDTAKDFTTTLTGNTLAGYVAEVAASAATEGVIDLDPAA